MYSTHATLIDKSRKARTLPELESVLNTIKKQCTVHVRTVFNLTRSASKFKLPVTSTSTNDDEIKIDHSGTGVKKLNVKAQPTTPVTTVLKSFKPPKLGNITQHTDVINGLYDKALELDSVEALLLQSFAGVRGQPAALKAVRELKKSVDSTLQKAFTSLAKVSSVHLPKELKLLGDSLTTYLIDNLDKESYSNMSENSYVFRTKEGLWQYTYYVTIENLKNESGYTFDDYNVVLSAMIDKNKHATYHLTTLADFRIPGKFPLGKVITSAADIKNVLSIMLRHNDVINVLDKQALPLNTEKAKKNGLANIPGVKDVAVEDDTLILTLTKKNPTPVEINNVKIKVLPLLNLLIGNRTKKSVVTSKLVKGRSGAELQFILISTLKDKSVSLNLSKLEELRHALDLSDDEVAAIKNVFKHTH